MKYFLSALYILTALLFMMHPEASREAAGVSLDAVRRVVLCSLFPMTVLTRLISGSEAVRALVPRIAKSPVWRALRLSDALLPAVISGLISGLPTAAHDVGELARRGAVSPLESRKTIALASLPSPVFVIMTSDCFGVGVVCYLLLVITAYLTALCLPSAPSRGVTQDKSVTLSSAMTSAAASMLNVSGCIIFFTAVIFLIKELCPAAGSYAAAFFEMGSGVTLTQGALRYAALGWCGLSALSQIRAEAEGVEISPYILTRAISVIIMIIYEKILQFFS